MGTVEPQVAAGSEVNLASAGQIVAKMRKHEGMEHNFGGPVCRELSEFRPSCVPR
jgi:hypothetical protein